MNKEHKAAKAATKKGDSLNSPTTDTNTVGMVKAQSNQATATETQLDANEQKLLAECEADISQNLQGWCVLGFRLWQIREQKLYRTQGNRSFETYLAEKWDYSKAHANRLIKAHLCLHNLKGAEDVDVYLPTKESEVRQISNLPEDQQILVASEVKATVGNNRSSAEDFKAARDKLFPPVHKEKKVNAAPQPAEPPKGEVKPVEAVLHASNGSKLVPHALLKDLADSAYNTCGLKPAEALKCIAKLQRHLGEWAKAEAEQLSQEEAV